LSVAVGRNRADRRGWGAGSASGAAWALGVAGSGSHGEAVERAGRALAQGSATGLRARRGTRLGGRSAARHAGKACREARGAAARQGRMRAGRWFWCGGRERELGERESCREAAACLSSQGARA
jgi:hypothetical protein